MVEVAQAAGANAARLGRELAEGIDEVWLAGVSSVGLSSGASGRRLVQDVVAWLADHGYTDMEEVSHTEERLTFALPQELRRDLRTARR